MTRSNRGPLPPIVKSKLRVLRPLKPVTWTPPRQFPPTTQRAETALLRKMLVRLKVIVPTVPRQDGQLSTIVPGHSVRILVSGRQRQITSSCSLVRLLASEWALFLCAISIGRLMVQGSDSLTPRPRVLKLPVALSRLTLLPLSVATVVRCAVKCRIPTGRLTMRSTTLVQLVAKFLQLWLSIATLKGGQLGVDAFSTSRSPPPVYRCRVGLSRILSRERVEWSNKSQPLIAEPEPERVVSV